MLSRAGANAIAEIIALNIPSLLVPLSAAASRGDQILNAEAMKKKGYCEVLFEEELNRESLCKMLNEVYEHRHNYINKMREATKLSGIQKIMLEIQKYQ